MRKLLTFFLCLIVASGPLLAQTRTIKGKIVDEKGTPLPGVSVLVKGTQLGTSSTADGTFSIKVPESAKTLSFTAINFAPLQLPIRDNMMVQLQSGSSDLSEVVVVAYGTTKKTNVTGSVATLKGDVVADKPFTSVDKALQGNVAGLQSTSSSGAPGSATDIRIRGIGSINASASPLWVIDGVIASTGDFTVNTTTANVLSSINPDDIESITVLKDAAATSIYGSRAANGVILVTTKKGKAGQTRLNFSTEIGDNTRAYNPSVKPLTTPQSVNVYQQALINAGYAANTNDANAIIFDPVNGFGVDSTVNTNWFNVVNQPHATQQQYNLSLSGGNDKTQFYASGGYFNQDGTTLNTYFKRYNGSISVTHHATDKITFATGLNGSTSEQSTPNNGGAFANPVLESFFLLPWYSPRNADGSLKYNDPAGEFPLNGGIYNPLVQGTYNKNTAKQTTLRGYVSGEFQILKNLKFTSRYSGEYFTIQEDQYRNPFYGDGYSHGGDAFSAYTRVFDWTWSNFADFRQNLNKANDVYFDAKLGYEAQQYNYYNLRASAQGFPGTLALEYLASAATPTRAYALPSGNATNSIFSNADFNYKNRYVISGSFRRDGSSVFGVNNRYGNFFSIGATWNVNEENFMKSIAWVNLLKLRTSYGSNGNSLGFGNYQALATYGYGNNYTGIPGSAPSNIGNPNLTWEKNKPFDVGVDFSIFKDRLFGTVDFYSRTTSDLLANTTLSPTSGFPGGQLSNVGSVKNQGIEITVGGKPIVTKNFSWTVSFNFAHNKNTVESLFQNKSISSGAFYYTVGHDLQEFYLRQYAGVDPANGDPNWYTDASRKTKTNNYAATQLALSGMSAAPKYYGSLTNSFTYKNFSLDAQLFYNYGNYLFDQWGSYLNSDGAYYGAFNQMNSQLNAWKKPGDITRVPKIIYGGNKNGYRVSTRYLYKGDYVRLRNIQLNYILPSSLVRRAHLTNVTVYVSGTNLFTFGVDKNVPFDPETGINGTGNLDVFIPKTISGGIKIGL
ncbi:TonB-dependent receptor [Hydrotalea sp.]|uniref:SusC/RagA family TonB-linked outer membrane protein n=1 Tax=Hydrotalea sp. TaxID=2881279 RepID=UPI00261C3002|nr:TonB-dependent receptor [Hydrotalea sp.]